MFFSRVAFFAEFSVNVSESCGRAPIKDANNALAYAHSTQFSQLLCWWEFMRGSGPSRFTLVVCRKRSEFLAQCKRRNFTWRLFAVWPVVLGRLREREGRLLWFRPPETCFCSFLRLARKHITTRRVGACIHVHRTWKYTHSPADALTTEDLLCEPKVCCC